MKHLQRILLITLAIISLELCGCLPIPHYHIILPQIEFVVYDSLGSPISTAKLNVYTTDVIGHRIESILTEPADKNGVIKLSKETKIHWFLIGIPDGEAGVEWAWCIGAQNYRSEIGWWPGNTDSSRMKVILYLDSSGLCCPEKPQELFEVIKKW